MKFYNMGRHFRTKPVDDEDDHSKQPGCISGLVHALAYHHRSYNNGKKMIRPSRYGGQTGLKGDYSPKENLLSDDGREAEKHLDGDETPHLTTKRCRGISRKSLRSRIRELMSEEMRKEGENAKGSEGLNSSKSRLQRTYSIHHLESLDDKIGKICAGWKQPIIFIPGKVDIYSAESKDAFQVQAMDENESSCKESGTCQAAVSESVEEPDFFDILKVDRELFMKKLRNSEEGVDSYTRSALGLNRREKERLSKSRSFPDHDLSPRLKFKPSKLDHKQKEIWSFPKTGKSPAVNQELKRAPSDDLGMSPDKCASDRKNEILDMLMPSDIMEGVAKRREEAVIARNHYHRRSASLNESLDRYARLFEHSNRTDGKLHLSKSLKITNPNGHVPMYFRRIRSLSNVDFYYTINFALAGDETTGDDSNMDGSLALGNVVEEEENRVELLMSDVNHVPEDIIEIPNMKAESESFERVQRMEDDPDIAVNVIRDNNDMEEGLEEEAKMSGCNSRCTDHYLSKDSDPVSQETLYHTGQLQNSEDRYIDSSSNAGSRNKNDSNLHYVRYILEQSGISKNASDRAWHSSDQPLSPELLEEAEPFWPHEADQFALGPKSCCCWHHQMLLDLTNEVLLQIYDHSLPYYPKALSSGCHVHPFPVGDHINEDVCTRIRKLLDLKFEGQRSLDFIADHDLWSDDRWMNLQFESQCVALELEDIVFNELLDEVMRLSFSD